MAKLVWDTPAERFYGLGIEKGVLYLPEGGAVVWNGLTANDESFDSDKTIPVYYVGVKINDVAPDGDYKSTLTAFTYPDEFVEIEGIVEQGSAIFTADQQRHRFGLSYQTRVGSAIDEDLGYQIHILYNLSATPSDVTYDSLSSDSSPIEFQWDLSAIPPPGVDVIDMPGYKPTAHVILDSRFMDPTYLEYIEMMLYGTDEAEPELPSQEWLLEWAWIRVVDNLDGTATASSPIDGLITFPEETTVTITEANVVYLDAETFMLSDTWAATDVT